MVPFSDFLKCTFVTGKHNTRSPEPGYDGDLYNLRHDEVDLVALKNFLRRMRYTKQDTE